MSKRPADLRAAVAAIALLAVCCGEPQRPVEWPPAVGQPFPDLTALDHQGQHVQLSSLRGKVLLIEPIGTSCPGCIAYCGGHEYGAFEGYEPQQGVASLESYFPDYAGGVNLSNDDVVVVQLLFFDAARQTPTLQEAMRWYQHFHLAERKNHVLLIGPESLREATFASIPGFWLVDRDFVLRADATGHTPHDNPYSGLMPMVPRLLARTARTAPAPR